MWELGSTPSSGPLCPAHSQAPGSPSPHGCWRTAPPGRSFTEVLEKLHNPSLSASSLSRMSFALAPGSAKVQS